MKYLIDTHCHLQDRSFFSQPEAEDYYQEALANGVGKIVCVGVDISSSRAAIEFSRAHENAFAIVGIHPHEAKKEKHYIEEFCKWVSNNVKDIIGIGEIGLDYFYEHSPKEDQVFLLEKQLMLAKALDLPVNFHVREAFNDFWPIYDRFEVSGVLHSFTDSLETLRRGLERGLFFGVNGISTFTKDEKQIEMFEKMPLDRILLETDAPYLTPKPYRGKINKSIYVIEVAKNLANRKGESLDTVASVTTHNFYRLFKDALETVN